MSDVIRAGYISAVNYQEGTAQVVYKDRDNATSPYMPLWSNEYNMPEIDDLVYVIHLENGSTRGMILVPPYTNGNRPVEGKKGIWRKDFGDGSYIRYDYDSQKMEVVTHSLKVEMLECAGDMTVSGNLTVEGKLKAKQIETTGDVHIGGNLTVNGSYPG